MVGSVFVVRWFPVIWISVLTVAGVEVLLTIIKKLIGVIIESDTYFL